MVADTAPVDWIAICEAVKLGEQSLRAIGEVHGVSHATIIGRRDKEGWLDPMHGTLTHANSLGPVNAQGRNIKTRDTWTPERAENILHKLNAGSSIAIAARSEGISAKSFENWRIYDPDFAERVNAARYGHLSEAEQAIWDAGKRGDWRASQSILEHASETRGAYQSQAPGAITFNIKVVRATQAEAEMIDVTPETVDG
ncbi:MAG: hypothetical protein J3T61_00300 [Candidatus Brocadiales bacterium]|nr:hypothetical protein [Candidatus Bathyanammoxibius sp.]